MNPMLLVALREFRQITATRSFWITLLLVPVAIGVSQAMAYFMNEPDGVAYVVVDETGRYGPAIHQRIAADRDREVLSSMAGYAERQKIVKPGAVWSGGRRWYSEADIAAYRAAGGEAAALAELNRLKPRAAADFKPPEERFIPAETPADVVRGQGAERFAATLQPHLKDDIVTRAGPRTLALGIYIPKDFGRPGATVGLWTSGRPNQGLIETVRAELTRLLRSEALATSGLDVATLARVQAVNAPIALHVPPAGDGRERMVLRSALPLALSYLLLMSLMITGSWMLQGLMEERSNKLLETLLACVRPSDLLHGKLVGIGTVGLLMILAWIGCAVGAAFAFQGAVADFLRPALASINSPWIAAALIYYFVAGYLCISMLFLAVGSLAENMRDAQGYLTPLILGLTLPFVMVMQAVIRDPDALFPRVMSWIPLYSPFAMMARLGSGVSPLEVAGSAAVLAVFVAIELALLGRLFQATLLRSGEAVRLKDIAGLIRQAET